MSEDDTDGTSSKRSSISIDSEIKDRFDSLRRQYSAREDEDMTGDDTLELLLDSFEESNDWADTEG